MDYELIVRTAALDVGIGDGLIAATAPGGTLAGSAPEELDGRALSLLPGGIDVHVHANEPGRTEWEGFTTVSAALAAGGFTSFFDMPLNASPPTIDVEAFDLKLAHAERASCVDFGLWGGLVPGNLAQLEPLHRRGVIGFKAFMCNSGIDDFRAADDGVLYAGMQEIAALGSILAVHAENDAITASLSSAARATAATTGRSDASAYLKTRPPIVELEAIGRAIALAADTGCRLHIVHVSTADGVELVQAARRAGVDVSWETCAHYLSFTAEDVERIGVLAKCSPVMRSAVNRDRLWAHVAADPDAIVASDHSPAPAALKPSADFLGAWGGISGAQSTRGVLLEKASRPEQITVEQAVAATAGNPAARFGLTSKGAIAEGYDADLALVDLDVTWSLTSDELRYRHRHSPFVGTTMRGAVRHVLRRGRRLVRDGDVRPQEHGRLLVPALVAAAG